MRELRRRVQAERSLPRYEPCLPRPAKEPPAGPGWLHEIKHDGFRIIAYRDGNRVRLLTRNGYDFADRFPLIVDAVAALRVRSCIVDGEAVACDGNGLAVFELLRYRRRDQIVTLCAFDLIEREGKDLRRIPIEERKHTLANLLCGSHPGIAFNQHYEDDGAVIYKHACKLGCEGIVSKRLGSPYESGRSPHWIKVKNPAAPAATRRLKRIGREGRRARRASDLFSLSAEEHFAQSSAGEFRHSARCADCDFREAAALQQVRKRQRYRNPHCREGDYGPKIARLDGLAFGANATTDLADADYLDFINEWEARAECGAGASRSA